jgi:hypothetical protein
MQLTRPEQDRLGFLDALGSACRIGHPSTGDSLEYMRNISFALTEEQVIEVTKSVTRRVGWLFLKRFEMLPPFENAWG